MLHRLDAAREAGRVVGLHRQPRDRPSPVAAPKREEGILVVARRIGSSFSMPMTES